MSLFHRHTDYSIEQGNIRYMDGSSLLRPMDMPRSQQIVMAVFVVIAVIIGVRLAAGAITAVNDSNTQNKASVEENLSRTVSYNLPVLTQMADMDDQAILDSLSAAGYTVYNRTAEGTAGLDLVKLPEDVTVADAAAMYAKGVGGLSASQAALLLNGSWTLTVDRSDTLTMAVKYADFSSSTLEAAIQAAVAAEGFQAASASTDTDEVGNTFQTGTVDIDDVTYTWRVSAAPLSDKYDIKGLPSTAPSIRGHSPAAMWERPLCSKTPRRSRNAELAKRRPSRRWRCTAPNWASLPAGPKPPYAAKQCARNAPSLTNTRRCARADAAKCT